VADAPVRNKVEAARARAGGRRRFRVEERVSSGVELAPPSDDVQGRVADRVVQTWFNSEQIRADLSEPEPL
jgi:hypothetical protein